MDSSPRSIPEKAEFARWRDVLKWIALPQIQADIWWDAIAEAFLHGIEAQLCWSEQVC